MAKKHEQKQPDPRAKTEPGELGVYRLELSLLADSYDSALEQAIGIVGRKRLRRGMFQLLTLCAPLEAQPELLDEK